MKSELEILKEKIGLLKVMQDNCKHLWYEPVRDLKDNKDCWSRTCIHCGKKEYTNEFEDVLKIVPKFK